MKIPQPTLSAFVVLVLGLGVSAQAPAAAGKESGRPQGTASAFPASQQKAIDFLMQQHKDGVFSITYQGKQMPDPAITGFGLMALQSKPKELRTAAEQKVIEQGLQWLLKNQNDDGSFGRQVQNYTTSVAVGALVRSNDPACRPALAKAQRFILQCQFLEQTGAKIGDPNYGAMGYGGKRDTRADLSNTNFALAALRETGLPADHDAFVKAITFLQRSQNLKSVNDFAGKIADPEQQGKAVESTSGDDGGGIYYPGNSSAGYDVTPDGKAVPRSYGSMTYSLLKAYTLCGLKSTDPRVQAAVKWVSANWTLAENPGVDPKLGDEARHQGMFYYYMVLAQALDLTATKELTAKAGQVDWRKELRKHLEGMQAADGSWKNDKSGRWMEDSSVLCTCYALVALEHCR
jgi:squalene-hopene/tetraprenyl-beta-curcumene cyclase